MDLIKALAPKQLVSAKDNPILLFPAKEGYETHITATGKIFIIKIKDDLSPNGGIEVNMIDSKKLIDEILAHKEAALKVGDALGHTPQWHAYMKAFDLVLKMIEELKND